MSLKKSISLVLIIIMFLFAFRPVDVSASSISDLQQKMQENSKKIEALKAEIQKLKGESASTANEISKLDLELESLNAEADGLQLEIDDLNSKIEANEIAIEDLGVKITENNLILEQRLRASYKRGDVGYIEIVLNSENLIDALTRMDMIQLIVKEDVNLLKDIQEQKTNLEELKAQQEKEKEEVAIAKSKLEDKKKQVAASQNAKSAYMAELQKDMKKMQEAEQKMEKENLQFEKRIQQLQLESEYAGGKMLWPLPTHLTSISSPFGKRPHPLYGYWSNHRGVDIRCPYNTEVYAANSGTVIVSEFHWSYGNYVIIDHGGKIATVYGHNTKLLVKVGQKVTRGQAIALSGSTGESTGPHLHFEVRENGVVVDPMPYLPKIY